MPLEDLPQFLIEVGVTRVVLKELKNTKGMALGARITSTIPKELIIDTKQDSFEKLMTLLHEFLHYQHIDWAEKKITEEEFKIYRIY